MTLYTFTDSAGTVHAHTIDTGSFELATAPVSVIKLCRACGGYGGQPGSNFGDTGWHSCYVCYATGREQGTMALEAGMHDALPYGGTRVELSCAFCPCGDTHGVAEMNAPLIARG